MGCSESAAVMEKPVKKQYPQQPQQLAPKPKIDESPHFLIGHIGESQFLFARVGLINRSIDRLSIPLGFNPHNFSSMLALTNKQYFISGGINFDLSDITSFCFLYDSPTHAVKQLSPMHQPRYTHASVLLKDNIYVIGGRYFGEDQVAILNSCEVYDLKKKQWRVIGGLNVKRCTCYALTWREDVYVFGGYTGEFERSEKIQKYNPAKDIWEIVNFALNRGIESCFVLSQNPNEVTILGGNTNSGPTASVITINFETQSVISHKHLKQPKMLHKCFALDELIFIFGGSEKGDLQIYDIAKNQSEVIEMKLFEQFTPEILQSLTMSQKNLMVEYSKEIPIQEEWSEDDDLILTFGTTEEPFIFDLNVSIPSSKVLPVPLSLKLFAQAGGVQLSPFIYFLFGGIEDDSLSSVTSDAYIYNHKSKTAKKVMSMLTARYSFSFQQISKRVYAIGGGTSDPDGNLTVLDSCEYYNLDKQAWNSMFNLPVPLISSMSLNYDGHLYVFGGLTHNNKRSKSICRYDEAKDSWAELKFHFPFGIEAASIYQYRPNQFYIFGGRIDNGDTDKIFDLIFVKEGETQCGFYQKGVMGQKKNNVKVFRPKNQDFIVCLGGETDLVSYYDNESLKSMQWDGLRRLKQVFTAQIKNLNSPKMKSYLTISPSTSFNK